MRWRERNRRLDALYADMEQLVEDGRADQARIHAIISAIEEQVGPVPDPAYPPLSVVPDLEDEDG